MKLKELVGEVQNELEEEKVEIAKSILKERIKEIQEAKKILGKLEAQYKKILDKDIQEIADDDTIPIY